MSPPSLALRSGVWKWRWTSWAPVPNKPTVSVDVKPQHFNQMSPSRALAPAPTNGISVEQSHVADESVGAVDGQCSRISASVVLPTWSGTLGRNNNLPISGQSCSKLFAWIWWMLVASTLKSVQAERKGYSRVGSQDSLFLAGFPQYLPVAAVFLEKADIVWHPAVCVSWASTHPASVNENGYGCCFVKDRELDRELILWMIWRTTWNRSPPRTQARL